jgi:dihydrofolate reductase
MRRLIMWNLMTLDGFFEGPSPWDLSFHETVWGKELEDLSIQQLRSADCLLFGRRTYEGMAAYWRTAQGEIAELMNSIPKVVCSRTLAAADWNNTTVVQDAAEGVKALKRDGSRNIFLFGSADLSRTLMENELFDEYRIGLVPVVLGAGRPLFAGAAGSLTLELQEASALSTGGVVLRYIPKR